MGTVVRTRIIKIGNSQGTVDKNRLVRKIGRISQDEQKLLLDILAEMFAD